MSSRHERAWPRVEAIIVFGGPQKILVVSRLRCEGQRRRDGIIGAELYRIVLGAIGRIDGRFDCAQIGRLRLAGIWVKEKRLRHRRNAGKADWFVIGKRYAVRYTIGTVIAVCWIALVVERDR